MNDAKDRKKRNKPFVFIASGLLLGILIGMFMFAYMHDEHSPTCQERWEKVSVECIDECHELKMPEDYMQGCREYCENQKWLKVR